MATYAQIAQETFEFNREDGSLRRYQYTFEKKNGNAQDYNVPKASDTEIKVGDRGDALNKPIKVHEASFLLKATDSPLIDEILAAGTRDIRVTIEDLETGRTEFQGFVLSDYMESELYNPLNEIEVTCYGGLADLETSSIQQDTTTIHELAQKIGDHLDLDRELNVFTSLRHQNQAVDIELPNNLRFNDLDTVAGDTDSNYWEVLKSVMTALGWRAFQRDGHIVFADLYDQYINRAGINKYTSNGDGSYTQGTEPDVTITVDETNTEKYPDHKKLPPVYRHRQMQGITERYPAQFNSPDPFTILEGGAEQEYLFSRGLALAGDIVGANISAELTTGNEPNVSGTVKWLRVELFDYATGSTWYYNPSSGSVEKDTVHHIEEQFGFVSQPGDGSKTFDLQITGELFEVPEEIDVAEVRVIALCDVTVDSGDITDIDGIDWETLIGSIDYAEEDAQLTLVSETLSDFVGGDTVEGNSFVGDINQVEGSIAQSFWYNEGGQLTWYRTQNWLSDTGNGTLVHVVGNRVGRVAVGDGREYRVRLRDTQANVDVLSAFRVKREDGSWAICLPTEITHNLDSGWYVCRVREAFDAITEDTTFYTTGIASEAGGSVGDSLGSSSPSSGTNHHNKLLGLNNPDDHPWAAQIDLSNIDWNEVNISEVRTNIDVYAKAETYSTGQADNLLDDKVDTDLSNIADWSPADGRFLRPADLQGTTNQVSVTDNGNGTATVGTPQDIDPTATPDFAQLNIGNAPSQDNHVVRAAKQIQTSAPLSGGDKLRNLIDIKLQYNATNLKVNSGQLDTAQDIHQDAEMILKTLMLKEGLTLDDVLGYIKSEDLSGWDYISEGLGIEKDNNGDWSAVLDNLTVRKRAKFMELVYEQLIGFSQFLLNEMNEIDRVEQIGDGSWSWADDTIQPFQPGATNSEGIPYAFANQYRCYLAENTRLRLAEDDLVRRQEASGNNVGLTDALVINTEPGAADPADNTTERYFDIAIYNGPAPIPGQTFARLGNKTDPSRMGGIYFAGSGDGAPHSFMYDGVDRFDKFGDPSTIKHFNGNTKGRSFPDIPELDGNQGDLYATITQDGYFIGKIVAGTGSEIDWSYLQNVEILEADIKNGEITNAKIANLNVNKLEGDYIEGNLLRITSESTFESDVDIRGTLNGVDGDFDGKVTSDSGNIGGLELDGGRLYKQGQGSSLMEVVTGSKPGFHFVGESGNEELWLGGGFSFDPENDVDVADSSFTLTLGSTTRSVSADAQDTHDSVRYPSSGYREGEYTIDQQYNGRQLRYTVAYQVSETTEQGVDYNGNQQSSSADAELVFEVQLLDSNDNIVESQSTTKTGNDDSQISVLIGIPSDETETYTIKYRYYLEVTATAKSYEPIEGQTTWLEASASASIDAPTEPMTILGINEFVSPLGASWVNESTGHRAYIRRSNGEKLANRHTIEDVDTGDQAWLVVQNGRVELRDSGGLITYWNLN